MNNRDATIEQLIRLGLSAEEAKLYLELLRGPSTHLKLAHATGINRTKIYRMASQLEKRSIITTRSDDRGTFLVASDPSTLEIALVNQEEELYEQRATFNNLLPTLTSIKEGDASEFVVHTYEGVEGFKQMLWHQLKAQSEVLVLGSGTMDQLVSDKRWAERHRAQTIKQGYRLRILLNAGRKSPTFTLNREFLENHYTARTLPKDVLLMQNQIVIYNDVVAMYHWRQERKVGTEILNKNYADFMRQVFEHYWSIANQDV